MRSRRRLAALLAAAIGLGLLSRRWPLPWVFAEHTGDALYATAATFMLALLAPGARTAALALAAFACSTLVELTQLVHTEWLDALRRTLPGRLLLGQGYQHADLLAYAIGAWLGAIALRALSPRTRSAAADRAPPRAPT